MLGRWSARASVANATRAATRSGAEVDDENVVALRAKIRALVHRSFGGSFRALYDHYGPHGADLDALTRMLSDADVGNLLTRHLWAKGVMERVDVNRDGLISWDEFAQIVGMPEASSVPAPAAPPPQPVAPPLNPALATAMATAMAANTGEGATAPAPIVQVPARSASVPRTPEVDEDFPVLTRNQAIGVAGGLFGLALLFAGLRAIGER